MIVDSGTSFLMLPHQDVEMFINYMNFEQGMGCVNLKDGITCACMEENYMDWFPDFTLKIGGKPYFIPKE